MAIFSAIAAVTLLGTVPAMADPPSTNPNVNPFTFTCVRGADTLTFQATGILQSAQVAGQRVDGTGVVVFKRLVIDGQLVFEVPGQAKRSDLWSCTVAEELTFLLDVFLTPRN